MRIAALHILIHLCFLAQAQFEEGFSKEEARDMIALCNSFYFIEMVQSDAAIIPEGYKKTYASVVFGMDNKYQIFEKENVAVISIRGSTDKKSSWLENFYSSMIPAKGRITIAGKPYNYCFAKDTNAAVHSGYALGIVILAEDIIPQINLLNKEGIYSIIITGHSQGGALAQMLRAYLENYHGNRISKKNLYKTYAFACPMTGNKEFADEYNTRFCSNETSFSIINPEDPVPAFPITYSDGSYVTAKDLQSFLFDPASFDFSQFTFNMAVNLFEKKIIRSVDNLSVSVSKQIEKELGTVVMPEPVGKINYVKTGNVVKIPRADYPLILKDSTILQNDSLMAIYARDANGNFVNRNLYKKESRFYQHKAYNYYTSFLKVFYPDEYKTLKMKYIFEINEK